MSNVLARLLALGFFVAATNVAIAGTYCVSTSGELQAALIAAKSDPDSTASIRMVSGEYAGSFLYATATPDQHKPAVNISGGWQAGCVAQTAAGSLIDGDLVLTGVTYADYSVGIQQIVILGKLETITWGAVSLQSIEVDGALTVDCCASGLVLDHSRIFGGNVVISTADIFAPAGSTIVIRDNLFAGNLSKFNWFDETHSGHIILVRGNTFAFLTASNPSPSFAVTLYYEPTFEFSRNLLTTPVALASKVSMNLDGNGNLVPAPSSVSDNWIGIDSSSTESINPATLFAGNSNVVGVFPAPYVRDTPPYNFRLQAGSPMIDYSTPTTMDYADTDLDSRQRVIGVLVDVGAYETSVDAIFQGGFEY